MKELRVGVVGAAGFIGREHTNRLHTKVNNARVIAVSDIDPAKTQAVADSCDAQAYADGMELIASPDVDAVVITSWDKTHADFVKAALHAGKPVFCEKPLASTAEECREIMELEMAGGRRMIQIGFMRRFDPGYLEMKEILDSGILGHPLMVHCKSRTPVTPPGNTTPMHATNVAIHEIDTLRWLLGEEYDKAQVIMGRSSCHAPEGLQDPQMMLLVTKSGVVIDVETAVNSYFGYEIQCEVVCDHGTVSLPQPSRAEVCMDHRSSHAIMQNWAYRFTDAYQDELQSWVDHCIAGEAPEGADAWDGYAADAVAEMWIKSQETCMLEKVEMIEKPAFYA